MITDVAEHFVEIVTYAGQAELNRALAFKIFDRKSFRDVNDLVEPRDLGIGDVDGDGRDDIVTGAGSGGGPHVRVFDGVGNPKAGFYAYAAAFAGGVNVASANVVGDGRDEIVTGAGAGGGPHVRVFAGDGSFSDTGFMAYWPEMGNGVYVAAGHIGTAPRIVTGPGKGANPHVKIFRPDGNQAGEGTKVGGFMAYGGYKAGVRVAVTP